jgi:hypothetical protein
MACSRTGLWPNKNRGPFFDRKNRPARQPTGGGSAGKAALSPPAPKDPVLVFILSLDQGLDSFDRVRTAAADEQESENGRAGEEQ